MKLNKKVLIPVFASAMGLSVIGGLTGAVAWYQYNSKVSTSFVGTSVADTGVLQLGRKEKMVDEQNQPIDADNDGKQDETIVWGKDYTKGNAKHLIPVTFGAFEENDYLDDNGDPTGEKYYTLPHTAYSYPEAGCGEGYLGHQHTNNAGRNCDIPGWKVAEEGKDYAEFEVYFKAVQTNDGVIGGFKQVEREVYMSNYIFESVTNEKYAHEALRVYLEINDGKDGTFLFANKEYKDDNVSGSYDASLDGRLNLFGPLNLNRSNEKDANPNASETDKYYSTLWNDNLASYGVHPLDRVGTHDYDDDPSTDETNIAGAPYWHGEEIIYGNYGDKQATQKIRDMKQDRDENGKMPVNGEKKLFTTSETEAVKVRVVIWLEGWEPMKVDDSTDYKLEWNPEYSAETAVQVALQFDSGIFRGSDLTL